MTTDCIIYVKGLRPATDINLPLYIQDGARLVHKEAQSLWTSSLREVRHLLGRARLLVTTELEAFDAAYDWGVPAVLIWPSSLPLDMGRFITDPSYGLFLAPQPAALPPEPILQIAMHIYKGAAPVARAS